MLEELVLIDFSSLYKSNLENQLENNLRILKVIRP